MILQDVINNLRSTLTQLELYAENSSNITRTEIAELVVNSIRSALVTERQQTRAYVDQQISSATSEDGALLLEGSEPTS